MPIPWIEARSNRGKLASNPPYLIMLSIGEYRGQLRKSFPCSRKKPEARMLLRFPRRKG